MWVCDDHQQVHGQQNSGVSVTLLTFYALEVSLPYAFNWIIQTKSPKIIGHHVIGHEWRTRSKRSCSAPVRHMQALLLPGELTVVHLNSGDVQLELP